MKMPNHAVLFDPETGKVIWMFTNGNPRLEQDLLPPLKMDPRTGEVKSGAEPHHVLLDLTEHFTHAEMQLLHGHHANTRVRLDKEGRPVLRLVHPDLEGREGAHPAELLKQSRLSIEEGNL